MLMIRLLCNLYDFITSILPSRLWLLLASTDGGYLIYEHQSLGRVAFARQPIHSVIIQCSVGSLTKRTLPKRHSLSLGRAGSMTRPQLSAENHKPSTAARCADRALPKHCGQFQRDSENIYQAGGVNRMGQGRVCGGQLTKNKNPRDPITGPRGFV